MATTGKKPDGTGHGDSHLARCSSVSCAVARMARSRVPSPMSLRRRGGRRLAPRPPPATPIPPEVAQAPMSAGDDGPSPAFPSPASKRHGRDPAPRILARAPDGDGTLRFLGMRSRGPAALSAYSSSRFGRLRWGSSSGAGNAVGSTLPSMTLA
jgi:hypothetical protein